MAGFENGSRWTQKVLDKKVSKALAVASSGRFEAELDEELSTIADDVRFAILASGRGGSQRAEFANFQHKVTRSAAGRVTARLGWINYQSSAVAADGKRLWYQYHNWGFRFYGGPHIVQGLGFLDGIDSRFQAAIRRASDRYIDAVDGALS